MIDMYHPIALVQFIEFFQGNAVAFGFARFDDKTLLSFKNLVIGVAAYFQVVIDEPFMNCKTCRLKTNLELFVIENGL